MDTAILQTIERFESEIHSSTRDLGFADGLEFDLFNKDDDHIYTLQFDREDKTFSVCLVEFEPNGGDYVEEHYLETYSLDIYSKDYLIKLINKYLNDNKERGE